MSIHDEDWLEEKSKEATKYKHRSLIRNFARLYYEHMIAKNEPLGLVVEKASTKWIAECPYCTSVNDLVQLSPKDSYETSSMACNVCEREFKV